MVKTMAKIVFSSLLITFLTAFFLCLTPDLYAHDFWIEQQGKDFILVYGHGNRREEFDPSKIKEIKAFDFHGKEMEVSQEKREKGLLLKTAAQPSLVLIKIDDGYWSKTIYGWKNVPKREARRVVESIRSFYYSKAMISWSDMAQNTDTHMKLNIMPLKNPFEMKAGDLLPLKVLYDGRPLAGIEIEEGEDHKKVATTGQDGIARVQLTKGQQVMTAKYKERIKDDSNADYLSITSTLFFKLDSSLRSE